MRPRKPLAPVSGNEARGRKRQAASLDKPEGKRTRLITEYFTKAATLESTTPTKDSSGTKPESTTPSKDSSETKLGPITPSNRAVKTTKHEPTKSLVEVLAKLSTKRPASSLATSPQIGETPAADQDEDEDSLQLDEIYDASFAPKTTPWADCEELAPGEEAEESDDIPPQRASDLGLALDENLDDTYIERFNNILSFILSEIHGYAHSMSWNEFASQDPDDQPIALTYFRFLNHLDPVVATPFILRYIPLETQSVLGNPDLQILDLLNLPKIPASKTWWASYCNIAILPVTSRAQPVQKTTVTHQNEDLEVGLYVGGSTARKGVKSRIDHHQTAAGTSSVSISTDKSSSHWKFLMRSGVTASFRTLAWFPNQNQFRPWVYFMEGVFMLFLNAVQPRIIARYNPAATIKLIVDLRERVATNFPLPDFQIHGLNSAWSLRQGLVVPTEWKLLVTRCLTDGCNRPMEYSKTPGIPGTGGWCKVHGKFELRTQSWWRERGPCIVCGISRSEPRLFQLGGNSSRCSHCIITANTFVDKENPKKCPTCDVVANNAFELAQHLLNIHGQPFQCPFDNCHQGLHETAAFHRHMRQHREDRVWPEYCPVEGCGKGIQNKSRLQEHLRVHTGERPFPCNRYSYRAISEGALKVHIRNVHEPRRRLRMLSVRRKADNQARLADARENPRSQ